jgi:ParB-like chromosome segregation protein Spo0J
MESIHSSNNVEAGKSSALADPPPPHDREAQPDVLTGQNGTVTNKRSVKPRITPELPGNPRLIKLADIQVDAGLQIRAEINNETVAEYAEQMKAGDKFPPLSVYQVNGAHLLVDGFHRLDAAKLAGLDEILVEIHSGTRQDALKAALGANVQHGLRRSNADKRRAVIIAIKEFPDLSDRAIADMCGVGHHLVGEVKNQLGESPSSKPRLGLDGKRRKPSTQRAGDKNSNEEQSGQEKGAASSGQENRKEGGDDTGALIPPNPAHLSGLQGQPETGNPADQGTPAQEDRKPQPDDLKLADGTVINAQTWHKGVIETERLKAKLSDSTRRCEKPYSQPVPEVAQYQRYFVYMAAEVNRCLEGSVSQVALDNMGEALNDVINILNTTTIPKT